MGSKGVYCRAWHLNGSGGRGCDSSCAKASLYSKLLPSHGAQVQAGTAEEVLTKEALGSEHVGTHRQDSTRRKTMLLLLQIFIQ